MPLRWFTNDAALVIGILGICVYAALVVAVFAVNGGRGEPALPWITVAWVGFSACYNVARVRALRVNQKP